MAEQRLIPPPTFNPHQEMAPTAAIPPPTFNAAPSAPVIPPPMFDATAVPDVTPEDMVGRAWARTKRFGELFGENFAGVFGDTLPAMAAQAVNDFIPGVDYGELEEGVKGGALVRLRDTQLEGTDPIKGAVQDWRDQTFADIQKSQEERVAIAQEGPQGFLDENLNVAAASTGRMAAQFLLGGTAALATRNPMLMPSLMALYGDSALEKQAELEGEGMEAYKAKQFGKVSGAIEALTELPAMKIGGKIVDSLVDKASPLVKDLAGFIAADWSMEQVATLLGSINDSVARGEDIPTWRTKLLDQMPVSLTAPLLTGGIQLGAMKLTSKGLDKVFEGVDAYWAKQASKTSAPFTELSPESIQARDAMMRLKDELKVLLEERDALNAQIGAMPALSHATGQPSIDAANQAAGLMSGSADLGVWQDTGHTALQPWNTVSKTDPFLRTLTLQRGPAGEDLKGVHGADYINNDQYKPGTYLANTETLTQNRADLAAAEAAWKTQGAGLAGTFQRLTTGAKLKALRKDVQLRGAMVEEILQTVESWRQTYLPDHAFVLSFDRDVGKPNTLGTNLAMMKGTHKLDFLNVNMGKIIGAQFGYKSLRGSPTMQLIPETPTRQALRRVLDVTAHEFGHGLAAHWENTLAPHEIKILRQAYLDDVMKYTRRRDAGVAQQQAPGATLEERKQGFQRAAGSESMIEPPDMASDTASKRLAHGRISSRVFFSNWGTYVEWLAHQMGKSTRHQMGKESVVDPILQPIRKALMHFYRKNRDKWSPNETFDMFLRRSLVENRIRSVEEKMLDAGVKYKKAMDEMKANPPEAVIERKMGAVESWFNKGGGLNGRRWTGVPKRGSIPQKLDTYNFFMRLTASLLQMGDLNPHIPGLKYSERENGEGYIPAVYRMQDILTAWKSRGVKVAKDVINNVHSSSEKINSFSGFMFEADLMSEQLKRLLTMDELAALLKKYNLNEQDLIIANEVWSYLHDAISKVEEVRLRQVTDAELKGNLTKSEADTERDAIRKDFAEMKNRNYMPHTRFGKYTVHVVTLRADVKVNDYYTAKKIGDTISFEMYENRRDQLKAIEAARKQWGAHGKDVMIHDAKAEDDLGATLSGFDRRLALQVLSALKLTPAQHEEAMMQLEKLTPSEGFRKKMLKREGIPGYATRTVRVFSDYAARFSNFLARIETIDEMNESIDEIKKSQRFLPPGQGTKRSEIRAWVERHKKYISNPGNELAALRAAGFLWYLALVPQSALVNMSQVPMVAYPYLAARFGDAGAMKEIAKAMGEIPKKLATKGAYTQAEMDMMQSLGGLLDESFASVLGALQEGSILEKMSGGRLVNNERMALLVDQAQGVASFMFSVAEQYNRRIVALATYRLSMAKTGDHARAVSEARTAIEKTQFEYARFNRPELLRGKRSVFFLFQQYVLSMMYFIGKGGEGRSRYLMLALLLAGIQGLPGAENIADFVDWFVTKYKTAFGYTNPKVQVRAELRAFINDLQERAPWLPGEADTWMHGVGSDIWGFDLSGSLGLGKILPGTDVLNNPNLSPIEKTGRAAGELMGPIAGVPIAALTAAGSNDPDVQKRWEKAMPRFLADISKGERYITDKMETDVQGDPLAYFEAGNPAHQKEIIGQVLGFTPRRIKRRREVEWMANESISFYKAQVGMLYAETDRLAQIGTDEAISQVYKNIVEFNERVPPEFRIGPKQVITSLKTRAKRRELKAAGYGKEKKYAGYYSEYIRNLDPSTSEEMIPQE